MGQTEDHLKDIGVELPPAPKAAANYVPCQTIGDMLYLSGHLPMKNDGTLHTGVVTNVDNGYSAARQAALNLVATIQANCADNSLDNVVKIVKIFGIVQSDATFHDQHKVLNGASDVLVEIFGEDRGRHARSAIGTNALPLDISVEVEAIVQVKQ